MRYKSFQILNRIIALLFLGTHAFLFYELYKKLPLIAGGYLILAVAFTVVFVFLSELFSRDFKWNLDRFHKLQENKPFEESDHQDNVFMENSHMSSLFKKTYIAWKLAEKDLHEMQEIFKKFIPEDIYKEIGAKWYERLMLGDSKRKILTVMFIDIIGFTTITEKLEPIRALMLLNIYFDGIGQIVYAHGWFIDKYLGDGIMIVFDSPHPDNAVKCAIEIHDYMKKFQITSLGKKIGVWIGINTGEVIMGTVGTKKRMDATVIGDTVNTASRLEWLTRKYKKGIIISKESYDALESKKWFNIEYLGYEAPEWKTREVTLYSVSEYYQVSI